MARPEYVLRHVEQYQRGVITRAELSIGLTSSFTGLDPKIEDSWMARAALAGLIPPDRYMVGILTQLRRDSIEASSSGESRVVGEWSVTSDGWWTEPNARPEVRVEGLEGGWVMVAAHWHAAGLAGLEMRLDVPEMVFLIPEHSAHTCTAPGTEVVACLNGDSLLVAAHSWPRIWQALEEVSSSRPTREQLADSLRELVVQSLDDVLRGLAIRRDWRYKHPSWGVVPPLADFLAEAHHLLSPHDRMDEEWAEMGGAPGVFEEVRRLAPSAELHHDRAPADLRRADTALMHAFRSWSDRLEPGRALWLDELAD